jgi:hypothetical protein
VAPIGIVPKGVPDFESVGALWVAAEALVALDARRGSRRSASEQTVTRGGVFDA